MKSFTAILFAALAILTFTFAVPLPEDPTDETTGPKADLRNQDCKKPFQAVFDKCMMDGGVATVCREPYDVGNKECDTLYTTSVASPI